MMKRLHKKNKLGYDRVKVSPRLMLQAYVKIDNKLLLMAAIFSKNIQTPVFLRFDTMANKVQDVIIPKFDIQRVRDATRGC